MSGPAPASPGTAQVFRPSPEIYRDYLRRIRPFLLVYLVLLVLFVLLYERGWARLVVGSVYVVILVGAFGLKLYAVRSARLHIDATNVRGSGSPQRRPNFARSEIGSVLTMAGIKIGLDVRPVTPELVVLARDGRRLLWLRGSSWDVRTMEAVVLALDAPVTRLGLIRRRELRRRYPKAVPRFMTAPALTVALVLLLLLVVVLPLVVGLLTA